MGLHIITNGLNGTRTDALHLHGFTFVLVDRLGNLDSSIRVIFNFLMNEMIWSRTNATLEKRLY